eukprot:TRINITY_DN12114_c0_g1_i10.p1 TRINITY_DN12114_c0_g1~~TRINITY_DN12114_c0_g1_i10.p1  ORF type:complete len:468 (-),score=138.29 TRINITY_DN12114_c0_g1_i10:51-1454(-)
MSRIRKLIGSLNQLLNKYKRTNHVASLAELLISSLNRKLRLTQSLSGRHSKVPRRKNSPITSHNEPLFMIEEAEAEEESMMLLGKEESLQVFNCREEGKDEHGARSAGGKPHAPWRFSSSISVPLRKPFGQTLAENQMEKIFSAETRQKIQSRSSSFELSFEKLHEKILDDRLSNSSMLDYISQYFMRGKKRQRCRSCSLKRRQQRSAAISIDDFELVQTIRSGKSLVVKAKNTNELYLMDTLRQATPNESIQTSFSLMKLLNSQHVARLCFTFPEKNSTVLVAEYVDGVDLGQVILKNGSLPVEVARKYLSEIVKGLECLHSNGLVHMNFGLDNIILGADGKIRLIKYWSGGTESHYSSNLAPNKTELWKYTSPKLIGELNVSALTNWWALGLVAYIMLFTPQPFTKEAPEQLYQNLIRSKSPHSSLTCALQLAKSLSALNPGERLGYNGATEVKAHPFFKEITWN